MEEMDSRDYEDLCETWKRVNQLQGANLNPRVVLYRADVQICEIGKRPRLLHIKEEQEDVTIKQEEEEEQQLMLTPLNVKAEDEEIPLLLLHNTPERDGFIRLLRVQSSRSEPPKAMDCENFMKKSSAQSSTTPSLEDRINPREHLNSVDGQTSSNSDHSENKHMEHQSGGVDFRKDHRNSRQIHKSKRGGSQNTNMNTVYEAMAEGHGSPLCSKKVQHKTSADESKDHSNAKKAPFSCPDCGVSFTFKQNLCRHMKLLHTGERPFSCTVCERKFAGKYKLTCHMSVCHPDHLPYSCSVCKKGYTSTKALESHRQSHAEKHICSECGKSFATKKNLNAHVRIHTNDFPLSCSVCNKGFIGAHQLQIHMRSHTGERPFSCSECGTQFKQVNHYHVHMRIHSGEKPFMCSVCQRRFCRPNHVTSHMKVHRKKKPFSCKVCYKEYTHKHSYKQHMNIHYIQEKYGVTYSCA